MLTKRKALEKTIEMWSWLAKHPNKNKGDYFEFKGIPNSNIPSFECYCCEFDGIDGGCRNCPITNWNYYSDTMSVTNKCTDNGSAYDIWRSVISTKTKKKAARRIAELAEIELNKLKKANADLVEIENRFYYSLSIVKENKLPHLSKTRDFDNLLENLSFKQLKKIEHILEAYPNKINIEVPRYEDGIPRFDGEFKLIVKDNSYEENGFEILVLKWIEDYEDTGYLIDCLKDD